MAIETPEYTVLRKVKNIEIRKYQEYIQAEVEVVEEDYKSAIEKGFGILAGYIFGNNISKQKINMTSPVKAETSERVPMTSPVKVSGNGKYIIAFVMPKKYSIDTLPEPFNKAIHFKKIDPHRIAAVRFSGFFNQQNIEKNITILKEWLNKENIKTEGEYVIAGYNPPWVPWFLARNEAMIQIKE